MAWKEITIRKGVKRPSSHFDRVYSQIV